ncbi:16S rRNA (cytosine(1402)-N(4))-methyltransferase RsmH [Candidatus Parcubacteria bacterium]|nr:16S rRNA (cytosine(1402)-N(4))-methyltransferase RsmH [Candidatus Parcubacteria bacterium]
MHIPVLKNEVIEYLEPKENENFIDCTIGAGGHTLAILEKNQPKGKVLGIEIDPEMYENLRKNFFERLILVQGSYIDIKKIAEQNKFAPNGILFDLGMSSWHIEKSGRGFSFMRDEPLDMRYSMETSLRAEEIVNKWSEQEIEKNLREYGGEKFSKRIASNIILARKKEHIKTTAQLKNIIIKAIPAKFRHSRIHCATRSFQALRIAVNDELNNLKNALEQAIDILEPCGRIVIISFHSGEDKIVKNFFKEKAKQNLMKILTKKPIKADEQEIKINPRSRSALLRAAMIS